MRRAEEGWGVDDEEEEEEEEEAVGRVVGIVGKAVLPGLWVYAGVGMEETRKTVCAWWWWWKSCASCGRALHFAGPSPNQHPRRNPSSLLPPSFSHAFYKDLSPPLDTGQGMA